MVNKFGHRSRGFTLIEVTIVMALIGLILVMVFLALRQTNMTRRDGQRKADLGRIQGALQSYSNNNNDTYPDTPGFAAFWSSTYINDLAMADPSSGSPYLLGTTWPSPGSPAALGTVYYRQGFDCNDAVAARGYSIRIGIEAGTVCRDTR